MAEQPHGPDEPPDGPARPWLLPGLLALVVVLIPLTRSLLGLWHVDHRNGKPRPDGGDTTGAPVSVTVEYGDGRSEQLPDLPWREGMTVETALSLASQRRPGGFTFQYVGGGATGFLTSINGVENQGAGGRNWQYEVNGERAKVSFCVQELGPGDAVLWTLRPQGYDDESEEPPTEPEPEDSDEKPSP